MQTPILSCSFWRIADLHCFGQGTFPKGNHFVFLSGRWVERLLIVGGGIFFGYLGYRLFVYGVTQGTARLSAQSKLGKMFFSGTAPGLFFMACGCGILVGALVLQMRSETRTPEFYNIKLATETAEGVTNSGGGVVKIDGDFLREIQRSNRVNRVIVWKDERAFVTSSNTVGHGFHTTPAK